MKTLKSFLELNKIRVNTFKKYYRQPSEIYNTDITKLIFEKPIELIFLSFSWDDTTQKYNFWQDISDKWSLYIENEQNIKIGFDLNSKFEDEPLDAEDDLIHGVAERLSSGYEVIPNL